MKTKSKSFVIIMFVTLLVISSQMNYITLQIYNIKFMVYKFIMFMVITSIIWLLVKISIINIQEILMSKKAIRLNIGLWCLNYLNIAFLITIDYFIYLSTGLPIIVFKGLIILCVIIYVLWIINIFKKKNQLQKLFNQIYLLILILILINYILITIVKM